MQKILFVSLLVLSLAVIVFPLKFNERAEKFKNEDKLRECLKVFHDFYHVKSRFGKSNGAFMLSNHYRQNDDDLADYGANWADI